MSGATATLAAVGLALLGVARTTGSGWLLVLLSLLVAIVLVGAVGPVWLLARLRVAVDAAPADAVATRPFPLAVAVDGAGLRIRATSPSGDEVRVDGPTTGVLTVTPGRRGVVRTLTVEVRSAAPFGLVTWRRRIDVQLPHAIDVAPLPSADRLPALGDSGALGADATGVRVGDDAVVRTVRPYEPGDPLRLVHWPATARAGEVMVKQLEAAAAPAVVLVVDLRSPDPEATASRAAAVGRDALARGLNLTVLTHEAVGPVAAAVRSPGDLGRRLARAVAGAPPDGPIPDGAFVVRA